MVLGYATRREFDSLRNQVAMMDAGGTRGMGGVQVQVGELIKDVATLAGKLEAHERSHVQEAEDRARERREARRYALTTTIAAVATLLALIAELVSRAH